jgi:hypothetical protein
VAGHAKSAGFIIKRACRQTFPSTVTGVLSYTAEFLANPGRTAKEIYNRRNCEPKIGPQGEWKRLLRSGEEDGETSSHSVNIVVCAIVRPKVSRTEC